MTRTVRIAIGAPICNDLLPPARSHACTRCDHAAFGVRSVSTPRVNDADRTASAISGGAVDRQRRSQRSVPPATGAWLSMTRLMTSAIGLCPSCTRRCSRSRSILAAGLCIGQPIHTSGAMRPSDEPLRKAARPQIQ